jgi:hypothetical protein
MPTDHMHRWENATRQRYYLTHVHVDLLGDRVISCYWGGLHSRLGGERHLVVAYSEEITCGVLLHPR